MASGDKQSDVETRISPIQLALALTLIWSLAFLLPYFWQSTDSETVIPPLLAITSFIIPLMFIWLTAYLSLAIRRMQKESRLLRASIEAMHQNLSTEIAAQAEERDSWSFFQQEQMKRLKSFVPDFDEMRQEPETKAPTTQPIQTDDYDDDRLSQPGLPLGHPASQDVEPLNEVEKLRAINFPTDAQDNEGLRLMQRAVEDQNMSALMRSARRVLSALAEDGIFMDDLVPDPPQAKVWRKFTKGTRGTQVAALGGIRDRTAFAVTKGRLKGDVKFREEAHNFMREFDRFLTDFESRANDPHLLKLGQTRSARAFMLIGRCTKAFERM